MQAKRDADQPMLDDAEAWAIAEDVNRQRPDWLVTWGTYSHEFVAYPLFSMHQRVIVTAHYPDALAGRMDEVERRWRIRPVKPEGNQ